MCDWCSWIEKDSKIYYLTDDMITAKWPHSRIEDRIGHTAIEAYYPEAKGGEHCESPTKIPPEIAVEVNKGHCNGIMKAGGWTGARYSRAGNLSSPWWLEVQKLAREVKKIKWMNNRGAIKPEWRVFDTREDADEVSRYRLRDKGRGDVYEAAYDLDHSNAHATAYSTAYSAAYDASLNVKKMVCEEAGRDAGLVALCMAAGFDETNEHYQYAQSRLDVWRAGYGLLCDAGGVLYVYRRIK